MTAKNSDSQQLSSKNKTLLNSLVQDLKVPLVHIARGAELSVISNAHKDKSLLDIEATATAALKIIDGYLMSVGLSDNQRQLSLMPVCASSVLYDVAHSLDSYAKFYDCTLQTNIQGKNQLVVSDVNVLKAGLTSIVHSFVQMAAMDRVSNNKDTLSRNVTLFTQRKSGYCIDVGVRAPLTNVSAESFKKLRKLHTSAMRSIPGAGRVNGAGIFIADSLFGALNTSLHLKRNSGDIGLAASLMPSKQLMLL